MVDNVLSRVPEPMRGALIKHRELLKFAIVGATTFVIDNGVWYLLKLTVLEDKPTTAKAMGIIVAMICNYVLNREWSFRTRGGRERSHEAALFFIFSGLALLINLATFAFSRYVLDLRVPDVSRLTQELADFGFGSVIGMLLATAFRYWAFKKWVFPDELDGHRAEEVRG
ncbi:GtrA family protein [Amycolatopsis antarctica]